MATTISKIILVRKADIQPDLFKDAPFASFINGQPLPLQPTDPAWADEAGYTHYAYSVVGMKLKDYEKLMEYYKDPTTVPMKVLEITDTKRVYDTDGKATIKKCKDPDEILDATFGTCGLKVCEVALEDVE
jgi:hypothetical protein